MLRIYIHLIKKSVKSIFFKSPSVFQKNALKKACKLRLKKNNSLREIYGFYSKLLQ